MTLPFTVFWPVASVNLTSALLVTLKWKSYIVIMRSQLEMWRRPCNATPPPTPFKQGIFRPSGIMQYEFIRPGLLHRYINNHSCSQKKMHDCWGLSALYVQCHFHCAAELHILKWLGTKQNCPLWTSVFCKYNDVWMHMNVQYSEVLIWELQWMYCSSKTLNF